MTRANTCPSSGDENTRWPWPFSCQPPDGHAQGAKVITASGQWRHCCSVSPQQPEGVRRPPGILAGTSHCFSRLRATFSPVHPLSCSERVLSGWRLNGIGFKGADCPPPPLSAPLSQKMSPQRPSFSHHPFSQVHKAT